MISRLQTPLHLLLWPSAQPTWQAKWQAQHGVLHNIQRTTALQLLARKHEALKVGRDAWASKGKARRSAEHAQSSDKLLCHYQPL